MFLVTAMGGTVSLSPPIFPDGGGLVTSEHENQDSSHPPQSPPITAGEDGEGWLENAGQWGGAAGTLTRVIMIGESPVKAGVGPFLTSIARTCGQVDEDCGMEGAGGGCGGKGGGEEEDGGEEFVDLGHGETGANSEFREESYANRRARRVHASLQVVRPTWLLHSWRDGRAQDTWQHRPMFLAGLTICCSGQGPERKAHLRSIATLFGAGWSDNLDKINCSILIVDCQHASSSTAAVGGAGVCNGTCGSCKSSKCVYARKHGIPLLSERWLWDSVHAGVVQDVYLESYALQDSQKQGVSQLMEQRIADREEGMMLKAGANGAQVGEGMTRKTSSPRKAFSTPQKIQKVLHPETVKGSPSSLSTQARLQSPSLPSSLPPSRTPISGVDGSFTATRDVDSVNVQ